MHKLVRILLNRDLSVSRYNNSSKDTALNLGPLHFICSLRLLTATDASSSSMIITRASEASFCICAGRVLSTGVGPHLALINICHPKSLAVRRMKCLRASVKRAAVAALHSPDSGEKHQRPLPLQICLHGKHNGKATSILSSKSTLCCCRNSPRGEGGKCFPTKCNKYSRVE